MSDEILIRFCAPTLAGLKTGTMFKCAFDDPAQMKAELRRLNRQFRQKGLRIIPLKWRDDSALLYLFRPKQLERDLCDPLARKILSECGYDHEDCSACIVQLIARMRTEAVFPHEVGLFLGYPPADVDGFMHRKEEYKLCGLWKVYDDVEGAARQFARCKHCTAVYLNCLSCGFSLDRLTIAG